VSSDGLTLATESADGVRLWRLPSGAPVGFIPRKPEEFETFFGSTGRLMISRNRATQTTEVWRSDGGAGPLGGAAKGQSLVLLADGTEFGVLTKTGTGADAVLSISSETGDQVGEIRGRFASAVTEPGSSFEVSGRHLVVGTGDGSLAVWDLWPAPHRLSVLAQAGASPDDVQIDPDRTRVLVRAADGARLYELASGRLLGTLPFRESTSTLEFSRSGRWVVGISGGRNDLTVDDDLLTVWEAASGRPKATMKLPDDVTDLAFDETDRTILIRSPDPDSTGADLRVWPIGAGRPARTLTSVAAYDVERAQGSSVLVAVHRRPSDAAPTKVEVIDAASGASVRTVDVPGAVILPRPALSIEQSAPLSLIVGRDTDGHTLAWNGFSGDPLAAGGRVDWRAFLESPTGSVLAGLGAGGLTLYDARTGVRIGALRDSASDLLTSGEESLFLTDIAVKFSEDGRFLAAGLSDEVVRVWDTADGHLVTTLRGHSGNIESFRWGQGAIGSDTLITIGATDSTVRLWRMPGGR
jgi:WD40 repeat protein